MVEKKEEEKKKEKWAVMEIPDTMKSAVVNQEKKEVYTVETALAKILNNQEVILNSLG